MELRDSQYKSYYNEKLMCLEQFVKLRHFQNQTYMKIYQAINQKHNAYEIHYYKIPPLIAFIWAFNSACEALRKPPLL